MSKQPQEYIEDALRDIEEQVKNILDDKSLSLTDKDQLIFPYIKKKRVLKQTIEDLDYLDKREGEEALGNTCKMSQYR